ncbi:SH3 domain containing protein [Acanthamoeba castellanii str. Neff]|uniref:SH3 domain containing protein n=1 Tax=Acanthamoeba castellanii (strain ATCC 30010 / Neff) TaxID=1257118 RepID=L8GRH9_ACACF|nr:SH3 domain containing protein [Acanthamoeba castellanii str. Neff]ELR15570.1 SH3 domain containing protein [Acanthamoeba castellanii str. Neff]
MATTAHREVAQAVANYDYAGRSDRELSFKKGQRISVFQRQESGWWVGEVEGKRGLFPGSFVQEWWRRRDVVERERQRRRGVDHRLARQSKLAPLRATTCDVVQRNTRGATNLNHHGGGGGIYIVERRGYTADILACGKVVALFDFTGDNDKKISFKRGDTINVLQKLQEEGWWEGELNGQVGLFPSNYVRLVEMNTTPASAASNPPSAAAAHSAAVAGTMAKPQVAHVEAETAPLMVVCLYDFKTDDTSKLSLKKGDEVEVVKKASESWWKGRMGKKIGYFPSSYVKAIEPTGGSRTRSSSYRRAGFRRSCCCNRSRPSSQASAMTASQTWLVAMYHYAARNDDELSFTKGDRVKLVEDLSVNWYRGELHGKVGRVPKNYTNDLFLQYSEAEEELERVAAAERERVAKAEAEGIERLRVEKEQEEQEEQERARALEAVRERAAREAREKEERERLEKEARDTAERERVEQEARERAERERVEKEAREKREAAEKAERERERIEKEARENEERERREKEERERQQLTADDPRAKERERRAREEEEMRLRESEYAAQQEQRRREPPHPVASRVGRSANLNRTLPPPPTTAGGISNSSQQPRAAPVPTLIPSTIPPLRKVSVGTAGEAAATATPGAGSSLPPPLVYSRPTAGSSGATTSGGAYVQRASSVPTMTPPSNVPRRVVPAAPVTVVTGAEGHQELRQEVEALQQQQAAGDEDESQLATTFEQLRRLVLDERRERRRMADRLAAVEERLAKLGV